MIRAGFTGGLLLLVALTGCTSASEKRDLEFQLHKARTELAQAEQHLASEHAQSLELRRRIESEQDKWNLNRMELARLRNQVSDLNSANGDLRKLIEQLRGRQLTRPEVPASPLPPEIDQLLQGFSQRLGDRVWYDRGRGALSFANDRLFAPGQDVVQANAVESLKELASILSSAPLTGYEVIIVGHTDNTTIVKEETRARHPSNWHLSVHRAIAVKDVLVDGGLSANKVGVMGYAQYRPVSDDRAANRRVEIFIVRKGGIQTLDPVVPGLKTH